MTGGSRSGYCQWVVLSLALGNLSSFILSELVSVSTASWLVLAAQVTALTAQACLSDTPNYYVMKGNNKKASETLCWLKCVSSTDITVRDDVNSLTIEQVHESTKLSPSRIFADKTTIEAFFIVLLLTVLRELCGSLTILTYSNEIFDAADRFTPTNCFILTSNQQGILVAMAAVLGLMLSCLIVNHCGAKPLLLASTMLISLSTSLLGVWYFVSHHGVALPGWVPAAAACAGSLADAVGLRLVCFSVVTEMFYHRATIIHFLVSKPAYQALHPSPPTSLLMVWYFLSHHGAALPGWVPAAAACAGSLADAVGLRLVCFSVVTEMFYHRATIFISLLIAWYLVSHHGAALPGWVPAAAACAGSLADAVGLRLVCFSVVTEMFYHRIHHTASTIFIAITALINLGQTRFFLPLVSCIGYHHVFFIFSGISILLFFYVVFNVPETKVREVEEIYDELKEDNGAITEDESDMVYPQLQDAILNEGSAYILTPFMSRRIWNR
ncbi:hypothetical protein JYU34_015453 [Plutella xylostella]|uniref:Uncharacterized protein n=1 Tax=Plutella xylostella TaxID=51655 RepID=A0ABQ7Q7J8_PLUXY|nr:hypothetical protein JYU34_015453 [Plutella xylostella]